MRLVMSEKLKVNDEAILIRHGKRIIVIITKIIDGVIHVKDK